MSYPTRDAVSLMANPICHIVLTRTCSNPIFKNVQKSGEVQYWKFHQNVMQMHSGHYTASCEGVYERSG